VLDRVLTDRSRRFHPIRVKDPIMLARERSVDDEIDLDRHRRLVRPRVKPW